jgi:GNAT superfamily N-acetyltransferase
MGNEDSVAAAAAALESSSSSLLPPSPPTRTDDDDDNNHDNFAVVQRVTFRTCRPTDIATCVAIEAASYPPSEAASAAALQYRQHHAAPYFMCCCAVVEAASTTTTTTSTSQSSTTYDVGDHHINSNDDDAPDTVIGFVCGTKCHAFTHETMSVHDPTGTILAVHSVVLAEPYRRRGIATRMLRQYVERIREAAAVSVSQSASAKQSPPVQKIELIAKARLLSFYVNCGFQVMYVFVGYLVPHVVVV